jgi:probable rRNA maturation factor
MTQHTDNGPFVANDGATVEGGGGDAEPPEPRPGLTVDIVTDEADWSGFGDVEAAVTSAAAALGRLPELAEGSALAVIALSSDAEVAALNGTYRGKPKPTNVLSFPALPTKGLSTDPTRTLGDIIIARETVLAEAADQDIHPAAHLQHLVIHGLLHLLGYDHETDADATVMEALEVRLLASVGVHDPYRDTTVEEPRTPR